LARFIENGVFVNHRKLRFSNYAFWFLVLLMTACSRQTIVGQPEPDGAVLGSTSGVLTIPELESVPNLDRPLRVVATTGIVGDVVSSIAGDDATVNVMMDADQDPHSYQTTVGDLKAVAEADVVFVNGWGLEQGLINGLENAAGTTPIVPISAGIEPRLFQANGAGDQSAAIDPHVWLAPLNVIQWVDNVQMVLSTRDPGNSASYAERAEDYRNELRELDAYIRYEVDRIDDTQRVLVTNHDAFGYFADTYGFKIVGTIIPGTSSLAEPASQDLARLVELMRESMVCSIYTEHSANQRLATQLSQELDYCDDVKIVSLYSGALGGEGSGAETYLDMMRVNIERIVGTSDAGE
jgi:zinc/manganese transport system substrate-binding protein/manganese/iron transport system substrate-binding protein